MKQIAKFRRTQLTFDSKVGPKSFVSYQPPFTLPLRIAALCLGYIYIAQYPLAIWLGLNNADVHYNLNDWIYGYVFVFVSALVWLSCLAIGMRGTRIIGVRLPQKTFTSPRPVAAPIVMGLVVFFVAWSYIMLKLKIGMTIYADFDALPYRLTGIMFYGRLFIQPFVLAYVAMTYRYSHKKWGVFVAVVIIGAWASLTSGSRLASILFSLPVIVLFGRQKRYAIFGITAASLIVVATLSRYFFLPAHIDAEYEKIYANAEIQREAKNHIGRNLLDYMVVRPMGMGEVLMTMNYGQISPSKVDSAKTFAYYFVELLEPGRTATTKGIYGLDEEAFGGYGLDVFSCHWLAFGGDRLLYLLGLAIVGYLCGRIYRWSSIGLWRFGITNCELVIFAVVLLTFIEARGHVLVSMAFVSGIIATRRGSEVLTQIARALIGRRGATYV